MIFVFGSNLKGIHGKGAALEAVKKHGAKHGVFFGRTGSAFAIPTKDENLEPLSLWRIRHYVDKFIRHASNFPYEVFYVTAIGTGLAGYKPIQIKVMFKDASSNCLLPAGWRKSNESQGKRSEINRRGKKGTIEARKV